MRTLRAWSRAPVFRKSLPDYVRMFLYVKTRVRCARWKTYHILPIRRTKRQATIFRSRTVHSYLRLFIHATLNCPHIYTAESTVHVQAHFACAKALEQFPCYPS